VPIGPQRPNWPHGVNIHGMSGQASIGTPLLRLNEAVTGSPTRSGLTPDFELFPCGYRVVPIPNRHGQPPKSSKSAAPATAVARRVGGLLPSGTTSRVHYFATRLLPYRATTFTGSCGRLRRLPDTSPYREKARGATYGLICPRGRDNCENLGRPKF
jgi:hypothetical protein